MKDYIDLTQLPAEKVEAMVLALSKNDFDLLRKYCDELGILYGYPMEEVVNIFSDQLLLSKKTLTKAVGQMDPESLASRVDKIEETLPSKADLSALEPIQQLVENISSDNSDINGRLDGIETDITTLSNSVSNEISTINEKIGTISAAHDNLAGSVNIVSSDLSSAITKLNTIQTGAEINKIDTIQLNGKSIQPINKTVNLSNVVVNDQLNSVINELNASVDTKLKTLKAETDGTTGALIQNVGDINNTLDSKLDISVAKQISGDLSSNIKSLSSEIDKNKTDFADKLDKINVSVLFNKEHIDNLAATDTAISNKIDSVSSELMGFIKGKVDDLDDELSDKVSKGDYDLKVDILDKKDNELADELSDHESKIKALNSDVDTNSRELSNKISAIYVTTTKSMLLPTNGVISIDVATTSIINAQISAMADVFHVTVDELVEHFNEDLSVISAALDAKTDISTFNIVSTNVDSLKAVVSDHTQKIDTLKAELTDLSIHTDELHQNSIALINELSTKHIKEIENEANIRREADRNLEIVIKDAINERNDLLKIEKDERVKTDDELKNAIKDLDVKLRAEIKDRIDNVTALKDKDTELDNKIEAEIYERKTAITDLTNNFDSKLSSFNERIITCETIVEQNRELYKTHDEQITGLLTTTATNTANIESLTTRLKDHIEAGRKRFDEINGKLDELEVAINGDKSGRNGLADRIAKAEDNIGTLNDTTEKIDSKLNDLADSIKNPESGLISQVNSNSKEIAEVHDVVDNLIGHVFGENGENGLGDRLATAEGNIATLSTTTISITADLNALSSSITDEGGLISQINANAKNITKIGTDVNNISVNIDSLISVINGTSEEAGLADKLSSLSDVVLNGYTSLSSRIASVEASSKEHTDGLNSISCTLYGNPEDSTDNGLVMVVDNLLSVIGGCSIGSTKSISERLDDISNDLNGNHADNPDIFGVHDRIEDLESDIPELSATVVNLQLSATATVEKTSAIIEKITSVSKDLDETLGLINDLSEKTTRVYEAIYGDDNPLNGLDNIVDELSDKIDDINGIIADHDKRIEVLENKEVDLSPIYVKLGEVENDISGLSAENESLLAAVEGALTNIDTLGDRIDDLEKNKVDLSPINVRLDDLETENAQLLNAVTVVQESIETLNDNLDENIEAGISDIFAAAIGNLSADNLADGEFQIKEITTDGSTMKDVIDRLNAIITVINNVAK